MTKSNDALLSQSQYIRELKEALPADAFLPDKTRFWPIILYVGLIAAGAYGLGLSNNVFVAVGCVILMSHSFSCLGFLAHELSHNAIIRSPGLRYVLEIIVWGVNLIPATLWDKVHNQTHHLFMNTDKDPDRQFYDSEASFGTKVYTKIFYPNSGFLKWNPMVGFHFIPYILRNIVSAFYPEGAKPGVVPYKPRYSFQQKSKIAGELVVIILIQAGLFTLVGGSVAKYLLIFPVSYLLASTILMSYIFTNHFINPLHDHCDPLASTTSVQVPKFFNWLHFNFSFHTEHHVFPSIKSKYYPLLSKMLAEKYPEKYSTMKIGAAWQRLWRNKMFASKDPI